MNGFVVLWAWLLWPLTLIIGSALTDDPISPTPLKRKIGKLILFLNLALSTVLVIQACHLFSIGWDPVIESVPSTGSAARKGGGLVFALAYKYMPYMFIGQGLISILGLYSVFLEPWVLKRFKK